MGFGWSWLISFAGCLTFLLLLFLTAIFAQSTAPFVTLESFVGGLVLLCSYSAFLALLLSWCPTSAGPVRQYLAAVTLTALVFFLVGTVVSRFDTLFEPLGQVG